MSRSVLGLGTVPYDEVKYLESTGEITKKEAEIYKDQLIRHIVSPDNMSLHIGPKTKDIFEVKVDYDPKNSKDHIFILEEGMALWDDEAKAELKEMNHPIAIV